MNGVDPPRGFAFAWFKIGNDDIGVYSLHLKSNLITHGDREAETAKNIQKREVAIAQLLTHIEGVVRTTMPAIKGVVIGGDFNTNHDQTMFAAERTLDSLPEGGYHNGFEGLPLSERVTHPGNHGFPDATFDFIICEEPDGVTAHCHSDSGIGSLARDAQFSFALKRASSAVFVAKKQCSKLRGARDYTGT
jgi:hypothetical protein